MKDEDIKLPEMPKNWNSSNSDLWKFIAKWEVSPGGRQASEAASKVEEIIISIVDQQCRAAVRLNQPVLAAKRLPFNLKAAKAGAKLVTRDGRKATYVGYAEGVAYPLVVLVDGNAVVSVHSDSGKSSFTCDTDDRSDLFLAPKPKRTVWVNVENFGGCTAAHVYFEKQHAEQARTGYVVATAVPIPIDDVGGEG